MSIAKKAVKESRDVARLAVDAAKNELIEQLSPKIRRIIDAQLRAGVLGEDVAALRGEGENRMRQAADYDGISDFEEGKDMKKNSKDKMESVAALFPGVNEMEDTDMATEAAEPEDETTCETAEPEDDTMGEELEISESELEEMYAEALQLEVDVSKGFKDMAKPHELGAGAKDQYRSDGANVADMGKTSEEEWDNVMPPEATNMIPESTKHLIRQGIAENKALVAANRKLTELARKMHTQLKESNLLNSKILHVNRFMQKHRLNTEQKKTVVESIDTARSIKEVKRVYGILESSFRSAGVVSEGRRKPHADAQKSRTGGAPNTKVLRESVDRAEGTNANGVGRWQQLAGLKKITG